MAASRLQHELLELMKTQLVGISAFPSEHSLFTWNASLSGSTGTPYEALDFQLRLEFTEKYPYEAPRVVFVTSIFHPNVDLTSGIICLDILKENWSAALSVTHILLSIQSLLEEPNVHSPLNTEAANWWIYHSQTEFREKVQQIYTL